MPHFDEESDTAKFLKAKKKIEAEKKLTLQVDKHDSPYAGSTGEMYDKTIKQHGKQGHGFAAEDANTTIDRLKLKNSDVIGHDNLKDGPDRRIGNTLVQTKYCESPEECIEACFKNGEFRYPGMKIEVPLNMGKKAWELFKEKMGWADRTDLNRKDYIIESPLPYKAAVLISKPFNPLSVGFDALSGVTDPKFLRNTGICSALAFAQNLWRGKTLKESFAASLSIALNNTEISAVSAIFSKQLSKATGDALRELLKKGIKNASKVIGKKIAHTLLESQETIIGGVISSAAIITVHTIKDVIKLFRKHISVKQFLKNTAKTVISTTAGTAGGIAGAAGVGYISGGSAAPIGKTAGYIAGDLILGEGTKLIIDALIEDDDAEMLRILETEYCHIAEEYLVTESEAEQIVAEIGKKINPALFTQMFRSKDRNQFARSFITPYVERVVSRRKKITPPPEKQMGELFDEIVGNAIQSIEERCAWDTEIRISYKNHYGENVCPTCGAPLGGLGYAICNYCDNLVEIG